MILPAKRAAFIIKVNIFEFLRHKLHGKGRSYLAQKVNIYKKKIVYNVSKIIFEFFLNVANYDMKLKDERIKNGIEYNFTSFVSKFKSRLILNTVLISFNIKKTAIVFSIWKRCTRVE